MFEDWSWRRGVANAINWLVQTDENLLKDVADLKAKVAKMHTAAEWEQKFNDLKAEVQTDIGLIQTQLDDVKAKVAADEANSAAADTAFDSLTQFTKDLHDKYQPAPAPTPDPVPTPDPTPTPAS